MFEYGDQRPADRKPRTVQRMDEARALFPGSPEPGVHPPRLEIPAIGARTDLAVTALARQPDFKVIGLARRKTHVAGAEQHPPIMQAQPVEDRLGAGGHSLMLGVRLVGGGDRPHFDLFKLVLANTTARITTSRAPRPTEPQVGKQETR